MEKVKVLGYQGQIVEGREGFYVNFAGIEGDHWIVTGKIAQKYGLLRFCNNLDSDIKWNQLFSRINYPFISCVYYIGKRFPEFAEKEDLMNFINILNTFSCTNIINLKFLL